MAASPEELWRSFIALEISGETRRRLAELQYGLKRLPCRVSWAAPETIHLTLLFLGDILPESAPGLASALDAAAAGFAPFDFTVAGIGTFGPPRSPRVVWCGVREGRDAVIALQEAVCGAARGQGFFWSDTRPFSPHVTLGRVKAPSGADRLMKALGAHAHEGFGATHAASLCLMRSRLGPEGAVHTLLHAAPLAGARP